eukprot:TRINITY_DN18711_c0_g1_i3.p1 TRINITY_DN18711_c0_g1~~TRINITY_DN18711_c0_g1_i3.p1  ORF type:complete len:243 (+),score=65.73 TRINITY_DN18711_c0_g1_i3:203-931(+)
MCIRDSGWVLVQMEEMLSTADCVVELGAGAGLVGIVAALAGRGWKPPPRVFLTDSEEGAVALALKNAKKNGALQVAGCLLRWGESVPPVLLNSLRHCADGKKLTLVLGSDVVFSSKSASMLWETVTELEQQATTEATVVLLVNQVIRTVYFNEHREVCTDLDDSVIQWVLDQASGSGWHVRTRRVELDELNSSHVLVMMATSLEVLGCFPDSVALSVLQEHGVSCCESRKRQKVDGDVGLNS